MLNTQRPSDLHPFSSKSSLPHRRFLGDCASTYIRGGSCGRPVTGKAQRLSGFLPSCAYPNIYQDLDDLSRASPIDLTLVRHFNPLSCAPVASLLLSLPGKWNGWEPASPTSLHDRSNATWVISLLPQIPLITFLSSLHHTTLSPKPLRKSL